MEKKRINNIFKILKLNNSINNIYDKLAKLEIEGKFNNQEYKDLMDIIKFGTERCDNYFLEYDLADEEMTDFIDLLIKLNNINQYDPLNYTTYTDTMKIRRFMEHNYELSLLYHQGIVPTKTNDSVIIDNVEYSFQDAIEYLEEIGATELLDAIVEQQALLRSDDIELEKDIDNFDLARLQLETHIYIQYLIDTIKEEQNKEVRDKLIYAKYRIIGTIRSLEKTFLHNPSFDNINIEVYHNRLDRVFKKRNEFYLRYIEYNENIINNEQSALLERNKNKYDNINDNINDILLGIKLQTHLSCIPNSMLREAILEDQETAIELTTSKLDKKVLKRSLKLNKKYLVQDKYQ